MCGFVTLNISCQQLVLAQFASVCDVQNLKCKKPVEMDECCILMDSHRLASENLFATIDHLDSM